MKKSYRASISRLFKINFHSLLSKNFSKCKLVKNMLAFYKEALGLSES